MSERNDGGPAFPTDEYYDEKRYGITEGMSLRDYFAAAALQALDIQAHVAMPAARILAESAYNIADAMLEARDQE